MPSKFTAYPKYEYPVADRKYQEIAQALGLPAATPQEGVASFVKAVEELRTTLNMPAGFKEYGIAECDFAANIDTIALNAFDDQCTGANPRYPLVDELKEILIKAYNGI